MKELIEKELFKPLFSPPGQGDVIRGKIIGRQKSALFLDLGAFGTGAVVGKEFQGAKRLIRDLEIGQEITAKVVDLDNDDGYIELSVAEAQKEVAWEKLKRKKESNESFPIIISKANKGGLMAEIEGTTGFLPVSQLKPEHYPKIENGDQEKIFQKLQKFIGEELKVIVLSLDPKQKILIFSEKQADLEKNKEALKSYNVGDIVEGKITGIVDFGAFIKFPCSAETTKGKPSPSDLSSEARRAKEEALAKKGAPVEAMENEPVSKTEGNSQIEGLIHISELDWQLIQDPFDVISVNEIVKAKIINITNGRVSLSLKALKKDPWENIAERYKKGDIVSGAVTKLNPFGAFVQIEPKIQGLIHISEFQDEQEMKRAIAVNKEYKFEINLIEPQEHRMILNLVKKIAQQDPN